MNESNQLILDQLNAMREFTKAKATEAKDKGYTAVIATVDVLGNSSIQFVGQPVNLLGLKDMIASKLRATIGKDA